MSFSPSDLAKRGTIAEVDDAAIVAEIDEALAPLRSLADLPTSDHVDVFETVQKALADALSTVDDA